MCLASLGCNRESTSDHEVMWNCHNEISRDLQSTKDEMVGIWRWQKTDCSILSVIENKEYGTLEFFEDSILLKENDQSINDTGKWDLIISPGSKLFKIQINPALTPLNGLILICGDRLELNGSHDGRCDQYFSRID